MGADVELLGLFWTASGPVELRAGRQWSLFARAVDETLNHRRPPGEGEFSLPGYVRVCQEHGYSGPWGLEVLSEELHNQPLDVIVRRSHEATAAQFCQTESPT